MSGELSSTRAARRGPPRVVYSNIDILLGFLCSNPRNEHCSGRGAGVLAVSIFTRTGAGSNEWRTNGRGTRDRQFVGSGEGGVLNADIMLVLISAIR